MAQKAIIHEETGRHLKMGRFALPEPPSPRLYADEFVRRMTSAPAEFLPFPSLAQPCMDRMLLNNVLSCCTIATTCKCSAAVNGDAGVGIIYDNAEVSDLYRGACGWDGTPATDNGGNEEQVIDFVTAHGIEKNLHHWAGKITLDAANVDQVKKVVSQTKNLFFGANLTQAWVQAKNGSVLPDGTPDPDLGHAFPGGGRGGYFNADGLIVTLWGGIECLLTWARAKRFLADAQDGELHSMVSRDVLRRGLNTTSSGFAWDKYAADFTASGGTLS